MVAQLITLSRLLSEALDKEDLETLCFDTFRPVYDQFTDGMTRGARQRLLVEHVTRQRLTAVLLREVRGLNAARYGEFVEALVDALLAQVTAPAAADDPFLLALQALTADQPRLSLPLADLLQAPDAADLQLILRTQARRQALTDETLAASLYDLLSVHQPTFDSLAPPPRPQPPPAVDDFVGRADDLAYFGDILRTRYFAVITGMAGVGKTLLAARLARMTTPLERIFWYEFRQALDLDAMLLRLAGFLYYQQRPGLWEMLESARQRNARPPHPDIIFDYVFHELHGLNCLLCLDEFHLVDEQSSLIEPFVERLAQIVHAGDLSLILAAQRMPPFVQTVQFRAVEGLTLTDATALLQRHGINLAPNLLAAVHGQTQGNAELLSLAAELLRRSADPAAMIARLSQQQDVERFVIREVDESLSDGERAILGAMSALLGYPATRAALSAILDRGGLQRSIQSLADRHLLTDQETAEGRVFSLHAMLRSFYYADLGPDERRTLHRRAAAFYEKEQPDPLRVVEHWLHAGEGEEAVAAATSDVIAFINHGQAHALLRLLSQLADRPLPVLQQARLALTRAEIQQFECANDAAQASFDAALALAERLPPTAARQKLIVTVCQRLGELLSDQAPDHALAWLQRGLVEVDADNDLAPARAELLVALSTVQIRRGDYAAAAEAVQAGLRAAVDLPDRLFIRAQLNLGIIASERGDFDDAFAFTRQAAAHAAQAHDDIWRVPAEMNLGLYAFTQGDWDGAVSHLTIASDLAGRVGSGTQRTELAINLGQILLRRGEDTEAGVKLQAALELARQYHLVSHEIVATINLAEWRQRRAELETALSLIEAARQRSLETGLSAWLPEIYRREAQIRLAANDGAGAATAIAQSLTIAAESPLELGMSLRVQGRALAAAGQAQAAAAAFARSLELLAGVDPYEVARTQLAWARLHQASGDDAGAQPLFDAAEATFTRLGARRDLQETRDTRRSA